MDRTDHPSTEKVKVMPGTVPAATNREEMENVIAEKTELTAIQWVDRDREFQYLLLMCHRAAEEAAARGSEKIWIYPGGSAGMAGDAAGGQRPPDSGHSDLGGRVAAGKRGVADP